MNKIDLQNAAKEYNCTPFSVLNKNTTVLLLNSIFFFYHRTKKCPHELLVKKTLFKLKTRTRHILAYRIFILFYFQSLDESFIP